MGEKRIKILGVKKLFGGKKGKNYGAEGAFFGEENSKKNLIFALLRAGEP